MTMRDFLGRAGDVTRRMMVEPNRPDLLSGDTGVPFLSYLQRLLANTAQGYGDIGQRGLGSQPMDLLRQGIIFGSPSNPAPSRVGGPMGGPITHRDPRLTPQPRPMSAKLRNLPPEIVREIFRQKGPGGAWDGPLNPYYGQYGPPRYNPGIELRPFSDPIQGAPGGVYMEGHPGSRPEYLMTPRSRSPRDLYLNRGPARWDLMGYKDPI